MIAFDAVVFEDLLYGDADRRTAAPDTDQKGRPKAAANDLQAEFDRIAQQRICRDKIFVQRLQSHRCSPPRDSSWPPSQITTRRILHLFTCGCQAAWTPLSRAGTPKLPPCCPNWPRVPRPSISVRASACTPFPWAGAAAR